MLVQISSGQGPTECRMAVRKLCVSLCQEFPGTELLDVHADFASAMLTGPDGLADVAGTVLWICKSPLRPKHRRKNWFIQVSIIPELSLSTLTNEVEVETFRSSGAGGQNVNKVETAVRVRHKATGLTVVCADERSQKQNKDRALARLWVKLAKLQEAKKAQQKDTAWQEHQKLVRGNAGRVYVGLNFELQQP